MADDSPDVAAAKRAADLAKARFEEAKAETDLATLRLTGSAAVPAAVTPLTGETKLTDVTIESRILAQKAICAICDEIGRRVAEALGRQSNAKIVLYDANAFGAAYQYRTTLVEIDQLIAAYGALQSPPPGREIAAVAPIALATSTVSAAAGLLALFRTNTEIVGKTFSPAETVLVAPLAKALRATKSDWVVVYPPLNVPAPDANDSALLSKLASLLELRRKPAPEGQLERVTSLNDRVDKLTASLAAGEDPLKTPLSAMLKAERLAEHLKSTETHVLAASLNDVAGSSMTTRNLFTGTRLYFSGGAVATYFLIAADGGIQSCDTLYHATGFIEMTEAAKAQLSNAAPA